MLRPGMKPVDPGTPGVGRPSKPKPKPEESKPSYVPGGGRPGHPEPAQESQPPPGPPAFDAGPSPYSTQEVTSYAQPPSSEAEARRREERKERAKQRWEKARKQASAAPTPPETVEVADFDDLGWLDSEPLPLSDSPDWPGGVPLSQGQSLHVDHLLSIEDDTMVREMLIGIKRDGIPPAAFVNDYLSQFAEWGWDDLSSARTLQVLETVRNSDWDDLLAQADRELIETTAQDLADNTIEGLIVIDAKTGETLLNRTGVLGAGGSQYVGLQDHEVDAFAGLDLIFVHNHPNGSDASEADLRAALAAGAEMLMVVTPQGYEYVYIRGANGMVRMRAEEASYKVGPGTAAEHVLLEARSWEQARSDLNGPLALMMLQNEEPIIGIEVTGILRVYKKEAFVRGVDKPFEVYDFGNTPQQFKYLRHLDSGNGAFLIAINNGKYWIDTLDPDAVFKLVPFVEHEDNSTDATERVVDLGNSSDYRILPIIPDEKAYGGLLDIEISHRPWADRTGSKLGVRTRDYNRRRDIHVPFRLQTPVIGPDVRIELVVTGHKDLGKYVVVSFPASVYQSNDEIMRQLERQGLAAQRLRVERPSQARLANSVDHNPDRWHIDGRIFYAFAHLSEVYVNAGEIINSECKAIIGKTGATGKEGITHHLDLAILYIGSSQPGSSVMEETLNDTRKRFENTGSWSVEHFFDLVIMSQLYPNGDSVLYVENLESARIHPELDEFKIAEFPTSEGDLSASIYMEDE